MGTVGQESRNCGSGLVSCPPCLRNAFDAAFYHRFYFNPRTQVTTRAETVARARTVAALVEHLELPVRTILDAGCGLGWMRRPLLRAFPRATYIGIEVSSHICERYGWTRASIASYRTRARFDLVICYDVLQYLSDAEAARAIANLGRLCRGALFLHAPTREDWRATPIDPAATKTSTCAPRTGIAHGLRVASDTPASGSMSAVAYRWCNGSWLKLLNRTKGQVLIPVRGNPVTFWA